MGKRISLRIGFVFVFAAVFVAGGGNFALALDYPTRPITMVVPFPPGGGADLGSKVVAENRPSWAADCQRIQAGSRRVGSGAGRR
jgi:hypothetical protein